MKRRFLSVKELAEELGVHEDTIYRAHLKKLIPVKKVCKVLRFDLEIVLKALGEHASEKNPKQTTKRAIGGASRRRARKSPRVGKTGAEFPGFFTEGLMSSWTCSLGWFRFTVSDSTADEVIARVGGEWIKDTKGFLGYRPAYESQT